MHERNSTLGSGEWTLNQHVEPRYKVVDIKHSRSKQRTDQRVLLLTLKFLALKKTVFYPVKNTSQNFFDFYLPYSMQLFSADPKIPRRIFLFICDIKYSTYYKVTTANF